MTDFDERGHAVWNERFTRFAAHHGFLLQNCRPYRARTKGKVENGIGYVRKNFWPRVQTFTGLDDLNRQVRQWLDTVANVRVHGTTREIPRERLIREGLKPLNPMPFEEVDKQARKVSSDACVSYENNRPPTATFLDKPSSGTCIGNECQADLRQSQSFSFAHDRTWSKSFPRTRVSRKADMCCELPVSSWLINHITPKDGESNIFSLKFNR